MRMQSPISILVTAALAVTLSCGTHRTSNTKTNQVNVESPRVNFAFTDADVHIIIHAIAKISGMNIITPPELAGKVDLNIRDVSWKSALELAVKPLGFEVITEQRGILRIVAAKEQGNWHDSHGLSVALPRDSCCAR